MQTARFVTVTPPTQRRDAVETDVAPTDRHLDRVVGLPQRLSGRLQAQRFQLVAPRHEGSPTQRVELPGEFRRVDAAAGADAPVTLEDTLPQVGGCRADLPLMDTIVRAERPTRRYDDSAAEPTQRASRCVA